MKNFKTLVQFIKFSIVGFTNTAIDFGILNLLMWLTGVYSGRTIFLLNSISFLVAVTNSYIWNRIWTFKSKEKNIPGQFLQFLIISIIGILINGGIVYGISTFISPMFGLSVPIWANVAKAIATGVSLVWNFVGYKFIVFRKKKNVRISNL